MNNLLTAIYGKVSGSALANDVSGRVYLDQAPQGVEFPYVVFFIVSGTPDRTFTERYTDTTIQFSIFSDSPAATEITNIYKDLKALYDECALTITSSSLVWMREQNLVTMVDDITTPDGTQEVKHWAVDFEIRTSLN